jgi:oxysterol-binding protein-related protein 1/2
MALNEWTEEDKSTRPPLPPTDSRFRPDIRKMEEGDIDQAGEEKNRLEEKQRLARRNMEKRREEWQPRYLDFDHTYLIFASDKYSKISLCIIRWFRLAKHDATGQDVWVPNEKYWQRNWSNCPDIY